VTQPKEFNDLVRLLERGIITGGEFFNKMSDYIEKLPSGEKDAAMEALATNADDRIRQAALDIEAFRKNEGLSKNLEFVRQTSPLRPGVRLQLFGGYDNFLPDDKPWWLNGRTFYEATFVGFVSHGENTIPACFVEFDETIELPGHHGRYGVLFGSYSNLAPAWAETEDAPVAVHVVESLPEDSNEVRLLRDAAATETHATYRVVP
jgi:hypothetical protein